MPLPDDTRFNPGPITQPSAGGQPSGTTPPGPRFARAIVVIVALFIVALALLAHAH